MYWNEIIEVLKKETDSKDLRDPFLEGLAILKKVEERFIIKENSNYRLSNWSERIKHKEKVKEFSPIELDAELNKTDQRKNYWVILNGYDPGSQYLVYDCKPKVVERLVKINNGSFFIAAKKYDWLVYFKRSKNSFEVFKSGDCLTPWG